MKKLIAIVSICTVVYGCGSGGQKQQQATQAAADQAKKSTIDSITNANNKQKTIDSLKAVVDAESKAKESQTVVQPVATTATPTEKRKKGWNNTTKGAVIGTGVGAVTGALVSKHKGTGAVVGGLIGAGAGAGTGAIIDNNPKKKP